MNFGREFRWFGARFAVEHKESIDNMFYLHQIALNTFVLQMTWWFFVAVNVGRYTSTSWVSAFSPVHALWFFVLFQLLGNMVQSDISLSSEEAPRLYIVLRQTTAAWNFWSPGERSVFLLRQLTYVRHFRCRRFAMAKKIPAQAFYEEYHGHRVEHLRDLVTLSEQNECRGALHPECPLTKSFPWRIRMLMVYWC